MLLFVQLFSLPGAGEGAVCFCDGPFEVPFVSRVVIPLMVALDGVVRV